MRPIDSGRSATPNADPFDALLAGAFAAEPGSAQLARMDGRLQRALELGPARIGRRPLRRAAWVVLAAATVIAIGGAGTIALQRFEGWSAPDFDVAWERGAILGVTDEVDGYQVTIDRAYADAGQVMLAVGIEDLQKRPGSTRLSALDGTLVDDRGGTYEPMGGQSGPVAAHETAELWYFDPPAFPLEPGPRHFTLSLGRIEVRDDPSGNGTQLPGDGMVEVPNPWQEVHAKWVIDFDLDVGGGSMIEAAIPATGPKPATVTLESVLISPTRARVGLRIGGVDDPAAWEPLEVSLSRGTTTLLFGASQPLGDGTTIASAYAGADDPSGDWTVTVGELVGPSPAGAVPATPGPDGEIQDRKQRLRGPWTMRMEVPHAPPLLSPATPARTP